MVGEKRTERSNEDLPSCLTGEAPRHFNPPKRQATSRDDFKVASNIETDAHRLENRLKQCQYGKNTIGYDNYIAAVPKNKRHFNIDEHPRTPDPYEIQSKRAFEGRIKVWRRALHSWDTKGEALSLSATTDGSSLDSAVARQQKTVAATSRQADDSSRGSSRDTSIRDIKSNDCRRQLPHSVDASNRNYRDGKWEENGRSYNGGDSKHSETSSANQRFDQDISGGNDRWDNSANDRMRDNRRNDFASDVDRDRRDNSRNGRWIDTVNDRRDDREKFGGHSNKPYSGRASDTENVRDSRRNSNEFQNYNQRHRDDRPAYVAARIDDKKERRYENTKNLREENSITNVQKRNHSESSSQVENTYSLRESSGDRACLKSSESESAFPAIIQNEDSQQTSDYERDMELQSLGNNVAHDESDDEDLL